jgi:hypothetical protein
MDPFEGLMKPRAPSQKNADRVDYYQLHVFEEKSTSHSNMYFSLPFLGCYILTVRFVEVNKHIWSLEATNYFVAYIHYWMKS